jgi:hypothetical protein
MALSALAYVYFENEPGRRSAAPRRGAAHEGNYTMQKNHDVTAKKPKGSKLDAQKRAAYEAEVAKAANWDISGWPTWTITGRVLPERCNVRVPPSTAQCIGAGGRYKLRIEVVQSHIAVICAAENRDASIFEISDVVRSSLAFPVDYIAFQVRGAYEIVLDLRINNQSGEASTIPIFEPTFEVRDPGLCFDAHSDKSKILIPWDAGANPNYQPPCTT